MNQETKILTAASLTGKPSRVANSQLSKFTEAEKKELEALASAEALSLDFSKKWTEFLSASRKREAGKNKTIPVKELVSKSLHTDKPTEGS
jgi:hypothetical protein